MTSTSKASSYSSSRLDLKVEKDFGIQIQLSESQLRLQKRFNHPAEVEQHDHAAAPRAGTTSSAAGPPPPPPPPLARLERGRHTTIGLPTTTTTTTTARGTGATNNSGDEENNAEILRRILNKSNTRHSTGAMVTAADQKAKLRKILQAQQTTRSRAATTIDRAGVVASTANTTDESQSKQPLQPPNNNNYTGPHDASTKQQLDTTTKIAERYTAKSTATTSTTAHSKSTPGTHPEVTKPSRHPAVQKQDLKFHYATMKSAPQLQVPPRHLPSQLTSKQLVSALSDTSGADKNSKEDQKALLRKVLANSKARRENATIEKRISPRSNMILSQRKSMSDADLGRREPTVATAAAARKPDISRASEHQVKLSPRSSLLQAQRSRQQGLESKREVQNSISIAASNAKNSSSSRDMVSRAPDPNVETSSGVDEAAPAPSLVASVTSNASSVATSRAQKGSDVQTPLKKLASSMFGSRAAAGSKLTVVTNADASKSKSIPLRHPPTSTFDRISPSKLKLPPPEQELDSYTAFYDVLQKEGAGDHRELWRSFRSIFSSGKVELMEKQRRVKFDTTTKKTLTEMNFYLKRTSKMECKAETQLVNDKKFAKESKRQIVSRSHEELLEVKPSSSQESNSNSTSTSTTRSQHSRSDAPKVKSWMTSFREKQQNKSTSTNISSKSMVAEVTVPPEVLPSEQGTLLPEPGTRQISWLAAHREKQQQQIRSTNNFQQQEENLQVTTVTTDNDIKAISSPSSSASGRKRRITGSDAPPPPPWAKVQLKSTRDTSLNVKGHEEQQQPQDGSVPWLKVQLRGTKSLGDIQESVGGEEEHTIRADSFDSNTSGIYRKQSRDDVESDHVPTSNFLYQAKVKKTPTVQSFVPSTTSTSNSTTAPWLKVQLRGTKTLNQPWTDRNAVVHVEESHSVAASHSYDSEAQSEHSLLDSNTGPLQHSFPYQHPKTGKDPVVATSFVPMKPSSEGGGTVPWSKMKLKRVADRPAESNNAAPWAQVKLRKREDVQVKAPNDENGGNNIPAFRQMLRKTTPSTDEGEQRQDESSLAETEATNNDDTAFRQMLRKTTASTDESEQQDDDSSVSAEPEQHSKSEIQDNLTNLLSSRLGNAPLVPKVPATEFSDEPSPSDAKNALSAMLASRLGPISKSIESNAGQEDSSKGASPSDIKDALSQMFAGRHTDETTTKAKPVISVGDVIDFADLSAELRQLLENFILVDLWTIPGMPGEVVVLGSELILVAKPEGDTSKKRVVWHHKRDSIESITLDMARNVADLTTSDGAHKSLGFKNAEGCLRFAACFYQTPSAAFSEAKSDPEHIPLNLNVPNDNSGSTEQLNQEEQLLLQRYRAARKSKDADDLLKEMIGENDTDITLSKEEREIVEKYQKMLKMQIPPEAVQHKMTRDGVDQKLVDIVLNQNAKATKEPESGLSAEEEKIADIYRKMLKMRIPPEAVQHKMNKEGVDQKIIDVVLNTGAPASSAVAPAESEKPKSNFSDEEEKVIASYRKMLKMCIPPDAIRHKMKKDQVDEKIVFAIFPEDAIAASAKPAPENALTEEEQKIAAPYEKMLKMKIPPEAVRHKMTKDSVSDKIVAVVLGEDPKVKEPANALKPEEVKAIAGYKKMVKMHFPEEAIRNKMAKDGASKKVIESVFVEKKDSTPQTTIPSRPSLRGSNLVALHWTPLSGEELDNSVWRANKKRKVSTAQPETNDISKLIELFKKKSNPKGGVISGPSGSSDATGKAKLIDLNRANNIAICLKAFKDFTHKQLAETISNLDPQELIVGERVQFVKDILPNAQEVQAINAYTGDDSRLVPAEHFFRRIVSVNRMQVKVDIMKTMVTFKANAYGLLENYQLLQRACVQTQNSEKLLEVLEMVLHVGNIMNEGTRTGGAAGFKFDSLLKLTQTKSSDGKTTVLDYLVMIFVAKNKRNTLDIKSDFVDCQTASRMLISDMNADVKAMSDALLKCKTELKAMKQEIGIDSPEKVGPADASPPNPMAGLLAAIKARGSPVEESREPIGGAPTEGGAVTNYLEAIKAKKVAEKKAEEEAKKPGKLNLDIIKEKCDLKGEKGAHSAFAKAISSCVNPNLDEVDDSPLDETEEKTVASPIKPKRPATAEGGISRLEEFIADAEETMAKVQTTKNAAISACKALSKYCGESGGEQAATTLLGILSQFATNLSDAVKKYDRRLELEAKKLAQKQKEEQQNRRKTFVESKGFGRIVTSKEGSVQPSPPLTDTDDMSVCPRTPDRMSEDDVANTDVSQVQGNAKAKVVPLSKSGTSLITMVNKMLKEASPQARQDFQAGIVHEDVEDETLKAIYEKERIVLLKSPPRRRMTSGNLDLMSAIKLRRENSESD